MALDHRSSSVVQGRGRGAPRRHRYRPRRRAGYSVLARVRRHQDGHRALARLRPVAHRGQEGPVQGATGLESVEVVNFTTDADINAALASGQLQCGNIATHTAMAFAAAGLPHQDRRAARRLDDRRCHDHRRLGRVRSTDLKGKQVAYEEGTTSDILLNYALAQNGMTIADIEKVPMPAADAGTALIAGKVPVAVTYEPYLTPRHGSRTTRCKMLYSAGENPGLISDVFVVREEFLDREAGPDRGAAQGLGCGARRLPRRHREAAAPSSRRRSAPSPRNWRPPSTACGSINRWPRTRSQLSGDFLNKVIPEVEAAATKAGILQTDVDLATLIDGRFVDAATRS